MKKIILAVLLVLCLSFPAVAEIQLGKDFNLDGHISMGYVVSSDYSTTVDGIEHWFTDKDESGSEWAFQSEIGVTWKDIVRPYVFWSGISGTGANSEWAFNNYIFSTGIEYFFWKTNYGKLGLHGAYNITAMTGGGAQINFIDVDVEAKERSWIVGLDWRF